LRLEFIKRMRLASFPKPRNSNPIWIVFVIGVALTFSGIVCAQQVGSPGAASSVPAQESREVGPPKRIPRQLALTTGAIDGTIRETASGGVSRPVGGAAIRLRNLQTNQATLAMSSGDGVFRVLLLTPGAYEVSVEAAGHAAFGIASLAVNANEVVTLEITVAPTGSLSLQSRLPRQADLGPPLPAETMAVPGSYREFRHRLDSDPHYIVVLAPDYLPPVADVFNAVPDRWALEQPDY